MLLLLLLLLGPVATLLLIYSRGQPEHAFLRKSFTGGGEEGKKAVGRVKKWFWRSFLFFLWRPCT